MTAPLRLFCGFGIELEYMIVEQGSLVVSPQCDVVLDTLASENGIDDEEIDEIELGAVAVSNELAAHVVELKTNGPIDDLVRALPAFEAALARVGDILSREGLMLLPTAMHPTMRPDRDLCLWPRGQRDVYLAYDRIFGCQGHGWANVQSTHVNLPFGDDEEFGSLHAAVRAVLPLLPALAASSPIVDGVIDGTCDRRLQFYASNQRRLPSIIGNVVPEPVFSRADYVDTILRPMYHEIAPFDPDGVLQHEWLNSRGAIARFERDALEIRVLDVQETPAADLGIARLVVAVLRALVDERWASLQALRALDTAALRRVFDDTVSGGDEALVADEDLLAVFGRPGRRVRAGELWQDLAVQTDDSLADDPLGAALRVILDRGCLARRLVRRLGPAPHPSEIEAVYRELSTCLATGRSFVDG